MFPGYKKFEALDKLTFETPWTSIFEKHGEGFFNFQVEAIFLPGEKPKPFGFANGSSGNNPFRVEALPPDRRVDLASSPKIVDAAGSPKSEVNLGETFKINFALEEYRLKMLNGHP